MRTIIIDDEEPGRKTLSRMVENYCHGLELVGMADGVATGIELVLTQRPELIFLDIQLGDGTGFDLLKKINTVPFKLVIVSAFDDFALQAFEFSAINYILKPVDPQKLIAAVEQVKTIREGEMARIKSQSLQLENQLDKIALPYQNGIRFVETDAIRHIESANNYVVIHLTSGEQIAVTKSLKHFASLLSDRGFFRCHHMHLVNLKYVVEYIRGEGGFLILQGGAEIEVSRRRKQNLLQILEGR